ncbi:MAG TPA: ABC transporter ATP-binding protein [Candidatus Acidoferrales bacterium]|nr:ABC transporter ATP-binding protein [Candidatus Acidoferrales bacterium]
MADTILAVNNLVKKYGQFRAVDGISFTVPKGKVVGFLGPNGAGKTTTIQVLLGITLANGGTISYFGKDFFSNRLYCLQRINFTSAFNTLLGRISVNENLFVFAGLYQVAHAKEKIKQLLDFFEISDLAPELYQNLSAGQKTRVNLVKSLLNDPEMILMDEPTASLDPDIADKTLTLIEDLRRERNLTLLFTSHNMNEVTRICDEVIFLDHGKIVAQDTPANLTKRIRAARIRLTFEEKKEVLEKYLREHNRQFTFLDNHTVMIATEEKFIPKVLFGISKTGVFLTDIEIQKPTLEDVFLQIARKE